MNIKTYEFDKKRAKELSKELNININASELLLGRGFDENTIKLLTSSDYIEELTDNFHNMEEACEIIKNFLQSKSNIYIFGDYDSDGVNATYIMYNALKELAEVLELGCEVFYHVPERAEGYGLNIDFCKNIAKYKTKPTLVITVDNGITKKEEVKYLLDNNIEVIITDHHIPQPGRVPECIIIDSWLNEPQDINKTGLCGAAVAYKVVKHLYLNVYDYDKEVLDKYLPHASIATITDMMPVTDENIILIKNGLKLINSYPFKDMEYSPISEAMYHFADYNKGDKITPKDIAFGLGPQINSCGRLGNIQLALEFMLSDDYSYIEDAYIDIIELNDVRKKMTVDLVSQINSPKSNEACIIQHISSLGGLAGNVANKAMEIYGVPTILLTGNGDEIHGSARSFGGYDLQVILQKEKELGNIIDFGGHEYACGLSLEKSKIQDFKDSFNKQILSTPIAPTQNNQILVDKIVTVSDLNSRMVSTYNDITFFNELKKPVFYIENVNIADVKCSSNNPNNVCFTLTDDTSKKSAKVWSWGFGETYNNLNKPKKVNMVFTLERFKSMLVIDIHVMEAC